MLTSLAAGKKKEGTLHTDRPVFEFPNHTAMFPNQLTSMTDSYIQTLLSVLIYHIL